MVKGFPAPRVFTVHGFIHADTRVSGAAVPPPPRPALAVLRGGGVARPAPRHLDQPLCARAPHEPGGRADPRHRQPGRRGLLRRGAARPREARVFSAALVEPRKNTLGLVEAFARLRARGLDARLRLAGSVGDAAYARRVEERISRARPRRIASTCSAPSRARAYARSWPRRRSSPSSPSRRTRPWASRRPWPRACPWSPPIVAGCPTWFATERPAFSWIPAIPSRSPIDWASFWRATTCAGASGQRARQIALERYHPDAVAARTAEVYRRAVAGARR